MGWISFVVLGGKSYIVGRGEHLSVLCKGGGESTVYVFRYFDVQEVDRCAADV